MLNIFKVKEPANLHEVFEDTVCDLHHILIQLELKGQLTSEQRLFIAPVFGSIEEFNEAVEHYGTL